MRRFRSLAGACALLLAAATPSAAQEALVLSGGGSRGLAHAGVFLGLEELGYDPDIVVGSSMGAVVGALYAAGYEPEEIRERLLEVEWSEMFDPTPTVVGPEREARYPMLMLDLQIEQERLRLSRGLLGQWRVNRTLAHLLFDANARSRGDFDRLARRYRAVATDLETGDAVVLDRGDLARAARASIAVPGFFAPVQWEGRVLVDGGIADNVPTSKARALGAVRVVASDVSRPPERIHSLTPLAVAGRALDLLQENSQRDPVPPDALVLPDIAPGFSGATFPDDPRPLIAAGLAAARRDLRPAPPAVGRGERPLPLPPDSFGGLVVEAPDSALAALARHIFADVAPGPYDPNAVRMAVDRLYSTGLLEGVWPRVVEPNGAAPSLVLRLEAPPPLSLAAAAAYDNDLAGRAWATLDRSTSILRRPAVLSAAASLGGVERWGALSARAYPRSRTVHAWSLGAYVHERDVRFFPEDALGARQVFRTGGWLGLERPRILRDRLATATVHAEWVNVEEGVSGFSAGPMLRLAGSSPELRVVGTPMRIEAERRWGEVTYTRAALAGSAGTRLGTVLVAALLDLRATSPDAPPDVRPALGDEHAIPGFRWGEVRGAARAVVGLDVAQPVLGAFVRLRLRAGAVSEEWDRWSGAGDHAGVHVGAVWQSPFGPVEGGYGVNTRGDGRFDIAFGRGF